MPTPLPDKAIVEIVDSGCDLLVVVTTSKGSRVRIYLHSPATAAAAEAYASESRKLPYIESEELDQ